ncbi:MAG: phosphatase PAP2 family protein [Alphaproteobacteria bacterium]|nr:phosphatase PAP2 family protein [Alphaproteobacteria bacterium]MBU1551089.1 phosphatase PAP2 family protein [Alphaproteobacteria bacterium]MBU2335042.1 phosphatase PAP2 family protein [Alphaproteobacteria bacterium]MBU2388768.1 phosphatase PAP2 family protein [Alphaproteobacteria bacterium]
MVYVVQPGQVPRGTVWEKPMLLSALFTATFSMLLSAFPQIDLAVSRLFYVEGRGFPAGEIEALNTFRAVGQYFPLTLSIVLLFGLILKIAYPSRPCLFSPRFTVYFASLFLLGPALLVNGILKPLWDRPRPRNVLELGGDQPFVPAWSMGGSFFEDRSFVSGEAAVVVCLIPLAFFVPVIWRRCVLVALSAFAAATALNRIAFGAHFLSDVLIAAGLMGMVAVGLWYLIYVRPGSQSCDIKLDADLSRLGFALHARRRRALRRLRSGVAVGLSFVSRTQPARGTRRGKRTLVASKA